IIQSSQPRSLKFTCSGFLLHLNRDFLPCLLPCRLLKVVLRLLLLLNGNFTTRRAFSCPLKFTSMLDVPEVPLNSKQSCFCGLLELCKLLKTSNTSQPGVRVSLRYRVLESSGAWELQEDICRWYKPGEALTISMGALRNTLSSAPTNSSLSDKVDTSNKYLCLTVVIRRSCIRSSTSDPARKQIRARILYLTLGAQMRFCAGTQMVLQSMHNFLRMTFACIILTSLKSWW
uniref:Uncharacterized protein n=1 Tax=Leptobrachium leishanense TaxID=445787 RepID=A0A8C5N1P4_9ANUR